MAPGLCLHTSQTRSLRRQPNLSMGRSDTVFLSTMPHLILLVTKNIRSLFLFAVHKLFLPQVKCLKLLKTCLLGFGFFCTQPACFLSLMSPGLIPFKSSTIHFHSCYWSTFSVPGTRPGAVGKSKSGLALWKREALAPKALQGGLWYGAEERDGVLVPIPPHPHSQFPGSHLALQHIG